MPRNDAYHEPLEAIPFEGCVIIEGRNNPVAVALTPEAALETAKRITAAAHAALEARPLPEESDLDR